MENDKYLKYSLYWGDIHIHSRLSSKCFKFGLEPEGYSGSPLDCYRFAKQVANLDFAAVTDHDCFKDKRSMTEENWQEVLEAAEVMYKEGEFVTIPAYEYTSRPYGHYNVYFPDGNKELLDCEAYPEPSGLWKALEDKSITALTIPHHPARCETPVNWDYYHEKFEPVVEITSCWGDSEFAGNEFECDPNWSPSLEGHFVRDAMKKGYKLGFVGGGDIHNGRSGGAFNIDVYKLKTLPERWSKVILTYKSHPLGGGLTGVYASSLSRNDILEAIRKRRCYACSGYKIGLKFFLGDNIMGDVTSVEEEYPPVLKTEVVYPEIRNHLRCMEIIRNGHVLARAGGGGREDIKFLDQQRAVMEFTDDFRNKYKKKILPEILSPTGKKVIYYYSRVSFENGAKAWSSPIWLEE
jgi:hypothetical protein